MAVPTIHAVEAPAIHRAACHWPCQQLLANEDKLHNGKSTTMYWSLASPGLKSRHMTSYDSYLVSPIGHFPYYMESA